MSYDDFRANQSPSRRGTTRSYAGCAVPRTGAERDSLHSEFLPLISRLTGQDGECPESCRCLSGEILSGEIYLRFHALLEAYDPSRGVPLRSYLVRHLWTSIYSYARRWRRAEADRGVAVG